ncbi:MAG: tRNA preQ1(34) S-adenosylmethionine ribosyltransferase-isomerase QueA [Treponemataceae bacterium]
MKTSDFSFDLPPKLIAQIPSNKRGNDKLMLIEKNTGNIFHHEMSDLQNLIPHNTLIIFNDSRVRHSRVYAQSLKTQNEENQHAKPTKPCEFLFLNSLDNTNTRWKVMVKNAKKQKDGKHFIFNDGKIAFIVKNTQDQGTEFRTLQFESPLDEKWFENNGHVPLPPYIKREDSTDDNERYQTVYASTIGSAAAPTAGLHFTTQMLEQLSKKGIETAFVTLHVGLGTFLPVRAENIEDHTMHEEFFYISDEVAQKVTQAKKDARPILAIGTTSMRTLESAWNTQTHSLKSGNQSTNIFIYPGYQFKCVDMLFTNFHTPESTLLMLVSAFAGKETLFSAYQKAIQHEYRFFSYGDATLIR